MGGLKIKISSWLRVIFCIINNCYAIPVYLACFFVLQPLRLISPKTFWNFEGWLYEKLLSMVAMWAQLSGHKVYMSGDDISTLTNEESLFMSNHQSSGDIPVLMYTLRGNRPALRHVMWIMDWILQFLNFGWVSKGHGDCFILQGSDIRRYSFLFKGTEDEIKFNENELFKRHLKTVFCRRDRKWIMLFPEGGFLRKRRAGSQRFSERNNLPVLENVSMPRTGAIESIAEVLGVHNDNNSTNKLPDHITPKKLKYVIDCTIGYRDNQPLSAGSWIMGHEGPRNIYVNFRVYRAEEMLSPASGGENNGKIISDKWIYDRFIEKEKILKDFYETGLFPTGKLGIKEVQCNTFETILGHLFCLVPYAILWFFFF